MRKQTGARIMAFVLTLVMLLSTLPVEAFAAGFGPLTGSSAEYNEALLTQLQALCTEGQDATQILDTLRAHGLVDDEGFPVFGDTFDVDGTAMTDAELTAAAPLHEDSETLTIDGVESTWGQIKTLLAIRKRVNELQSFMNTGVSAAQASTPEYQAALQSLTTQLYSGGGLMTFSAGAVFGAGVNHQTRVSVSTPATLYENGSNQTVQLTASIPAALSYPVSFDYLAVSGSAMASGSGMATIPAGSTSVSFSVTYVCPTDPEQDQWESSGRHYYYVELSNLKNALFGNNGSSMTVQGAVAGKDDLNLTKTYTSSKYGNKVEISYKANVGYDTIAFPLSAVGLNAKYSWDITATLHCKMMRDSAATGYRDCTYFPTVRPKRRQQGKTLVIILILWKRRIAWTIKEAGIQMLTTQHLMRRPLLPFPVRKSATQVRKPRRVRFMTTTGITNGYHPLLSDLFTAERGQRLTLSVRQSSRPWGWRRLPSPTARSTPGSRCPSACASRPPWSSPTASP